MNIKTCLLIVFIIFLSTFRVYADNLLNNQSGEPMEITSSRMEAFNEKQLVVFSGNAVVKQGNSVLKSDQLFLYYKKEPDKKYQTGAVEKDRMGDLDRIEAKGNVSLTQGERIATGDDAIYLRESNKITLTGNAVLIEGKNSIKGDRVIIFLNENRGIVESNSQKQVKAIIYPQRKKKEGTH